MNTAYKSLIFRLIERDINPDEIPGLMRSVFWIMSRGGPFTCDLINEQLEGLGWKPDVLDEAGFRCLAKILQAEFGPLVKYYCRCRD
ncbi:MAG: hypothetical protein WCA08_02350 [Desulfoferrobacter sp.]